MEEVAINPTIELPELACPQRRLSYSHRSGLNSFGVTAACLCVLVHTGFCCFSFKNGICFPQSCGSSVIKSHWSSKSDSLEVPIPFAGSAGWEDSYGLRTITTVGEILWYYCSPVWGLPIWWVLDLILLWLCLSYHFVVSSPLSLDVGYHFFVLFIFISWRLITLQYCSGFYHTLTWIRRGFFFFICSSVLILMVVQQIFVILCLSRRRWVHILVLHCLPKTDSDIGNKFVIFSRERDEVRGKNKSY